MKYSCLICVIASATSLLASCSEHSWEQKPIGKRVVLAQGNVSLILPDTTLIAHEPMLWGPCYSGGDYSKTYYFLNADTSSLAAVSIKAIPSAVNSNLSWHLLFNEKRERSDFSAKNRNQAIIEKIVGDSITRTIEIEAHTVRWGRPSFTKEITVYGRQHKFQFSFSVLEGAKMREGVANSEKSILINPEYLNSKAEAYADFVNSQ